MAREDFLLTDYLRSFPDLVGSVDVFTGGDKEHKALLAELEEGRDWTLSLDPAEVVLSSSICHSLYGTLPTEIPAGGLLNECCGFAFRHEPSLDPARMQSFRMYDRSDEQVAAAGTSVLASISRIRRHRPLPLIGGTPTVPSSPRRCANSGQACSTCRWISFPGPPGWHLYARGGKPGEGDRRRVVRSGRRQVDCRDEPRAGLRRGRPPDPSDRRGPAQAPDRRIPGDRGGCPGSPTYSPNRSTWIRRCRHGASRSCTCSRAGRSRRTRPNCWAAARWPTSSRGCAASSTSPSSTRPRCSQSPMG